MIMATNTQRNFLPEFEIGDLVTFNPYGKQCKCRVKSISTHKDGRIFYELRGEAITRTTGLSIEESIHFEDCRLIALPGKIMELAEREGLAEPIEKFNSGHFEDGAKALKRALEYTSPDLRAFVTGAYLQAIHETEEAVKQFNLAAKLGGKLYETSQAGLGQGQVMLAFSDRAGGSNKAVVVAAQDEVEEVLNASKQAKLTLTARFPEVDPNDSPAKINTYLADFFKPKRFIESAQGSYFAPQTNPSLSL